MWPPVVKLYGSAHSGWSDQAAAIAVEATERLVAKLEHLITAGGGKDVVVEMGEEFRLLTLQVLWLVPPAPPGILPPRGLTDTCTGFAVVP